MSYIINFTHLHVRSSGSRKNFKIAFLEVIITRKKNEKVFVLRNRLMRAKIIAQETQHN